MIAEIAMQLVLVAAHEAQRNPRQLQAAWRSDPCMLSYGSLEKYRARFGSWYLQLAQQIANEDM